MNAAHYKPSALLYWFIAGQTTVNLAPKDAFPSAIIELCTIRESGIFVYSFTDVSLLRRERVILFGKSTGNWKFHPKLLQMLVTFVMFDYLFKFIIIKANYWRLMIELSLRTRVLRYLHGLSILTDTK